MTIADDWDLDLANGFISHIDGVLSYDGGTGTQPAVGEMIIGATSGAIGTVLARTGTVTSGTLTLTNVIGLFVNNEVLDVLSSVAFDGIGNGGFKVGDTITDQVTGTMDVKFIEYNIDGVAGHGTAFGNVMTVFTNDSALDVTGGASSVGLADGVGVDNDALFDALVNLTMAVPGTTDTNNSVIVHFDTGTIVVPEDAHIQSESAGGHGEGFAQRVYGDVTTGSIRVVDSDITGGDWVDDENLRILDVEFYTGLSAGLVFAAGDVLRGATSLFEARVLAVIVDTGTTGKLIMGGSTGTPWTDTEDIQVLQPDDTYTTYAQVDTGTDSFLDAALLNIDAVSGVRDTQRGDDQGGIFGPGSLNIVRSSNAFYTFLQDTIDELADMDKEPPVDGNVRDQLYTVLNQESGASYVIPDLSFRFLEKGAWKDFGNNNIFSNFQSAGVVADIGNHGFLYDSANPTPQPDIYGAQNGLLLRQDHLEGHIDVLIKVKTSTDPQFIDPAVEALGQLIDGGTVEWHLRPYLRTYDTAELVVPAGGQNAVFISNANDLNNNTAQYSAAFITGANLTVGEEVTTTILTGSKRAVVVAATQAGSGTITWVQKSGVNLVNGDVVTGVVSGNSVTLDAVPTNVSAGYGTDVRVMVSQRRFTGGTTSVAVYVLGELITQTGTGATGFFMEDDGGTIYIEEESGTFNATGLLTGANSGALNTPTGTALWGNGITEGVPKDIGGGVGDVDYLLVTSGDITRTVDATPVNARTVQVIYEWWKFILAKESLYEVNTPGSLFSVFVEGRLYRRPVVSFAEVRGASAFGAKAGTLVITAQGHFIEKGYIDTADIRSIQLVGNDGVTYDPPNLQALILSNLTSGVRGSVFRSTGVGDEVILRNEFDVGTVGGGNNQSADNTILIGDGNGGGGRTGVPTPNDIPDTGTLRILDPNGSGNYLRFPYSSVDKTTGIFTLASGTIGSVTSSTDLVADDNVHAVPIEDTSAGASLSNTLQYVGDIPLFAKARIKGKKPFKTTAVFGSAGVNIGANLNDDDVVNLP